MAAASIVCGYTVLVTTWGWPAIIVSFVHLTVLVAALRARE